MSAERWQVAPDALSNDVVVEPMAGSADIEGLTAFNFIGPAGLVFSLVLALAARTRDINQQDVALVVNCVESLEAHAHANCNKDLRMKWDIY